MGVVLGLLLGRQDPGVQGMTALMIVGGVATVAAIIAAVAIARSRSGTYYVEEDYWGPDPVSPFERDFRDDSR